MVSFGSIFGTPKKDLRVQDAEEQAFEEEKERRKQEKFERDITKAKARGKAKAMPASEALGKGISSTGKLIHGAGKKIGGFIQSDAFQGAARAGAGFSGGYTPRKRSSPRKSKGKKKGKSKGSHRRSHRDSGNSMTNLLMGDGW